ncbi:Mis12-domain-containing protein [Macrolepiota fuliginosa MF-IS2]|uniref:Mis12-domain-containing protein n=1 Tax=Macrolepiota fuliginosa MF-IS2 TaxID=1400762 RepID=A0A9P5X518_9AGAR|nr:Mis12-domain-containing protein [Macrolepiota fuliginosa MF-IS2]
MSVPPLLICEALGFSPQLLLDDIINVANQAVQDGVNGMEEFLQKWTDQRAEKLGGDWDGTQEVEQGLVAFQTLLEYHTDIAFDFFEAWSMRNIFAIPPDLPIVLPHQENLDLTATAEREQGLMDEIEHLRRKIDAQRKLRRVLNRAFRASASQRRQSEHRLAQLSVLQHPSLDTLATLPHKFDTMYDACSSVEPLDAATVSTLTQVELSEPGKRSWESTKSGYLKWATERLLAKAKEGEVDRMDQVGRAERLRKAIKVTENVRDSLGAMD